MSRKKSASYKLVENAGENPNERIDSNFVLAQQEGQVGIFSLLSAKLNPQEAFTMSD
jgi:hypothetical protein